MTQIQNPLAHNPQTGPANRTAGGKPTGAKSRLGLHYYPDTFHYREQDLATWLAELQALGVGWLTLIAPSERATAGLRIKLCRRATSADVPMGSRKNCTLRAHHRAPSEQAMYGATMTSASASSAVARMRRRSAERAMSESCSRSRLLVAVAQ